MFLAADGATADDRWTTGPAAPATAAEVNAVVARDARRCCSARRWEFQVALPIWVPGITGTMASGSSDVTVDRGLGDLLDRATDIAGELEFAFVGAVVVRRGPWRFVADAVGARVSGTADFTLNGQEVASAELSAAIVRARVGYRFGETCPCDPCPCGPRFSWGPHVGLRWYLASFEAETAGGGASVDADSDWVDPIVGVDATWTLSRRWALHGIADIGGFGLGSDLSWWLSAVAEFRISRAWSLYAGWQVLDVRRESSGFTWDLRFNGPMLGVGFRF
jgi:hypothetical protein